MHIICNECRNKLVVRFIGEHIRCNNCGKICVYTSEMKVDFVTGSGINDRLGKLTEKEVGYLVVKTEGIVSVSFPLNIGRNLLGRISDAVTNVDINLCDLKEEDNISEFLPQIGSGHVSKYTSRAHCVIHCSLNENNEIVFLLEDIDSANGTYINCIRLDTGDLVYLREKDVVQAGYVKFFVEKRSSNKDETQILFNSENRGFGKTVILK